MPTPSGCRRPDRRFTPLRAALRPASGRSRRSEGGQTGVLPPTVLLCFRALQASLRDAVGWGPFPDRALKRPATVMTSLCDAGQYVRKPGVETPGYPHAVALRRQGVA